MRVVKEKDGGIVRRVVLIDDFGFPVETMTRFLGHLIDAGYSPHTVCAYGYDLHHLLSSWSAKRQAQRDQIKKLAELRDLGLLTAEEFDVKKLELLSRL